MLMKLLGNTNDGAVAVVPTFAVAGGALEGPVIGGWVELIWRPGRYQILSTLNNASVACAGSGGTSCVAVTATTTRPSTTALDSAAFMRAPCVR